VVGWTRDGARVAGRQYALGLHGFAAGQVFALEAATSDFARLTLAENAQTRALYPFAFRLAVEYRLTADSLAMTLEVENSGASPMPYACGLHPGFRWPFAGGARAGAVVRFEKPERAEIPLIAPGGLISTRLRAIPLEGTVLPLSDALFAGDALCFLDPASRSLRFEEPGGAAIAMDFPGFDHAALWMRPGAPFLCLETWTGYSDPEGFAGDLFEKPSMRVLAPGAQARHAALYRFEAGA
jgi:galactose mutarotase-like enzyme